eukprot:TRINITY_DN1866_c0_g1_i1.p1 TRINITY_DN1866_c0_g1~~TRINITY_DN1866_c0_g1_i1.p1  ORF type:complete len:200 (+),score=56.12 TRINITY_DN1866_c0_g1_i1:141-740(+)
MIRRPPRSTLSSSSAASDVYKRQEYGVSTQSTGEQPTTMSDLKVGDHLSETQRGLLEQAFRMFDKDGSGKIDTSEFREVCRSLQIVPTDSELAMMVEEIDLDQSGDIDIDEFVNAISDKMVDPEGEDHIRAAFQMFDTDDSGKLSHSELHQVLLHLGENMAPDEIDKLIRIADADNDGEVDCREFMAMILDKPFLSFGR